MTRTFDVLLSASENETEKARLIKVANDLVKAIRAIEAAGIDVSQLPRPSVSPLENREVEEGINDILRKSGLKPGFDGPNFHGGILHGDPLGDFYLVVEGGRLLFTSRVEVGSAGIEVKKELRKQLGDDADRILE